MGRTHKRLLGTWKCDLRRTLATYKKYDRFSAKRRRAIRWVFGRTEIRYTPRFWYATVDGETTRNRYDVVAEDAESLVLRVHSDGFARATGPMILHGIEDLFAPRLMQLHFETIRGRDYYWTGLRILVEWSRRIA